MSVFKTVSIVIPVFNEEKTLPSIISQVEKAGVHGLTKEIIIVDDMSTDNSRSLLQSYKKKHRVIFHDRNMGKGAAVRTGLRESKGDIVIIQDADLEYNPDDYERLLSPIINKRADVVYGSRFHNGRPRNAHYLWHYVGNRILTTVSNSLSGLRLTDMETCYKAFSRSTIDQITGKLESDRFGFEPEITALVGKLVRRNNCKVCEVGISYHARTYEQGKKIKWKDGVEALWCIVKYNF